MAVVDIIVPTYKGLGSSFQSNLIRLMARTNCRCGTHEPWKCDRGKHSVYPQPQVSSCVIHWGRNHLIAQTLYAPGPERRPRPDFVLMLDDDILMDESYLERMLMHNVDVVYGICTKRRDPPEPTIRKWNSELGKYEMITEWNWKSQKLFEIDGAGAACLLIKTKVLERMVEEFLKCTFERVADKIKAIGPSDWYWDNISAIRRKRHKEMLDAGDWHGATAWWFDFMWDPSGHERGQLGEDMSFSWKLMQLGYKQYADPQVQPLHIGEYGYSIRDWIYHRDSEHAIGVQDEEVRELAAMKE